VFGNGKESFSPSWVQIQMWFTTEILSPLRRARFNHPRKF